MTSRRVRWMRPFGGSSRRSQWSRFAMRPPPSVPRGSRLRLHDEDLLQAVGVTRDGIATRAMVIIAGSPSAIREHVPNYLWTHARMSSGTDYSDRVDGTDAVTVALSRILDESWPTIPSRPYGRGRTTSSTGPIPRSLFGKHCSTPSATVTFASPVHGWSSNTPTASRSRIPEALWGI